MQTVFGVLGGKPTSPRWFKHDFFGYIVQQYSLHAHSLLFTTMQIPQFLLRPGKHVYWQTNQTNFSQNFVCYNILPVTKIWITVKPEIGWSKWQQWDFYQLALYYDGFITGNILDLSLTLRWLTSYIYGAPILNVSRSHTTTQHSR